MRFLYPPRMEKYILKTIGDRWRQHKSDLKAMYFDEKKSTEANENNKPKWVTPDQWRSLVNHWTTQKAKVLTKFHFQLSLLDFIYIYCLADTMKDMHIIVLIQSLIGN